jgi:hypothetical protein
MIDPLLRRFAETTDAEEAERELERIVEEHALPLARAVVGRKLRSYGTGESARSEAGDRDDVIADAMVTLVDRLQALRRDPAHVHIEQFANYAAAVVQSKCALYLRRRYPARARLKNRLRYVFSTDARLALWTARDGDLACGLAEWKGLEPNAAAERALADAFAAADRPFDTLRERDLRAAALRIAANGSGPVAFDALVAAAAAAARLVEPSAAADASRVAAAAPPADVALERRRFLERVWNEIGSLPVRQRIALLLNLRDAGGGTLLWLLPVMGVATIRQIARVLELADAELAALWREMPLDDHAIGRRLGCTRQQVINLRMSARKRLVNRVAGFGSLEEPARRQVGNLRPVSVSVEGGE